MKSMLGLPKLVQHLAGYVEVFGTEEESDLTQSWKYTDRWCFQHYFTHAKRTVYQGHAKRLNHFHTICFRKLLKIKRQDRISDTEVLKRAGMQSVHTLLKLAQLRRTGHVARMPDERLPKKILYGELQVGKRSDGGQKKRYKDTLKASLKDFNIPTELWERLHRIEQSGEASEEGVLVSTKQKESAKPSRNVHSGKPELRHHQQSFLPQTSLVLSATGSLELRLVSSAILEHTNNNTSHSWLGLVIVSNDRRTIYIYTNVKIITLISCTFTKMCRRC